MSWLKKILTGAGILLVAASVIGLFTAGDSLPTTMFNFAIIVLAFVFPLRRFVGKYYGGSKYDIRSWTFRYLIAAAGLFWFVGAFTALGIWNYGTIIIFLAAIVYGAYWSWEFAQGQPYEKEIKLVVAVAVVAVGVWMAVGVPWSQVQGPAGAVGATVESTVGGVTSSVSTAAEYGYNSMIRQNRQVARLQCIMEHGGPTGIAFTPSSDISKCVQQKLGQNETVTRSNRVTDPVEVQVEDPTIEPFTEEVRVSVPLSNTLVFDRFGVPIEDIPAKDVEVSAEWYYNNDLALRRTQTLDRIENGDSRVVDFTFEYAEPSSSFWDASELEIGDPDSGNLVPGLDGYSLRVSATYTYGAEAAFTESSRWRSGNNLLKVWRPDAWRERSLDFRERWERDNCDTVRRFGQEFDKQRTAALTTPVTPVMYADCATSLFRGFEGGTGSVPISVSATGPEGGGDVERFKVVGGGTNCGGGFQRLGVNGNASFVGWDAFKKWRSFSPGLGWGLAPAEMSRQVTIDGERTTVSCKLNMSIRTELSPFRTSVTLPDLLTEGEGTGVHTLDWVGLSIDPNGEAALTFSEPMDEPLPGPDDAGVTEPEGASVTGTSASGGSDTWELTISGVEEGEQVTLAITGTVYGEDGGRLRLEKCTVAVGGSTSCSSAGTPSE